MRQTSTKNAARIAEGAQSSPILPSDYYETESLDFLINAGGALSVLCVDGNGQSLDFVSIQGAL